MRPDSLDYETVRHSKRDRLRVEQDSTISGWPSRESAKPEDSEVRLKDEPPTPEQDSVTFSKEPALSQRRGHLATFFLLFLYATIAYFRPWDISPAWHWMEQVPYWLALTMLAVFAISQFLAEGNFTTRPREVNLVLLLTALALLSIVQANSPQDGWRYFNDHFIKTVIIFIVLVNVVRTRLRLHAMIFLGLLANVYISVVSTTHSLVEEGPESLRATAEIKNIFNDPNTLALQLVIMIPIALTLLIDSRSLAKRIVYGACVLVMLVGTLATLSRGGFLALVAAGATLAFKLGRRNRSLVVALILVSVIAVALLAPGGYGERLTSIIDPSRDPVGSAAARRALLYRSIWVSVRRPILGVGIGNFQAVSIHNQVSHNSYTQVSAELGMAALAIYVMFLLTSYRRLRQIEHETSKVKRSSELYYLSVGLQASLVGYMVGSFFLSVAFEWFVYFLVAYAICVSRLYQLQRSQTTPPDASVSAAIPAPQLPFVTRSEV